jgi:hypothetical protein
MKKITGGWRDEKISDYERGLYKATELGPMRWAKIAQKAKHDGYNDVRHFLECVMAEPPDYINGLLEGMGHAGDTIDTKDMIVEVEDQIIRAEHPEDFPE